MAPGPRGGIPDHSRTNPEKIRKSRQVQPRSPNMLVHFWPSGAKTTPPSAPPRDSLPGEPVKTGFGATRGPIMPKTMFWKAPISGTSLARLAWLALACLACLASDRPRSPCLHQQQQQRRSAPPGRRRRPGCCCLGAGKASEADPRRGKPSMPRPAKQADPAPENLSQRRNRTIPKTWFWS